MTVDAHHHLWDRARLDHRWLDSPGLEAIRRDFSPADLAAARTAASTVAGPITRTVAVQALNSSAETHDLLAASGPADAVVGWVDLISSRCATRLDQLAAAPGGGTLRGLRHLVQDEPDPRWLVRPAVLRGLAAAADRWLAFDLLVRGPQRPAALEAARLAPGTSFVIDHAGKPAIGAGEWEPWASWITDMAALPNVTCKLSGLVTECPPRPWSRKLIEPYARHVLESFGADRVMFGSDWPVCLLQASYTEVLTLTVDLLDGASPTEREAVLGGTARRVYRLGA
ncbi:amidohydrolase family protein [Tsukamurella paurometabola]|uniref:Predicted metal-dependent hydrolase of the TIM-barrel fold n=1 Tax=Tsukamurella paurometabola TaxID=2061 RepID=A0A3P8KNV7_TSUPA|nr:amidohydrolase family protein [Tsukamurella paurometabola]UEA85118.1 amidohydrolase family protein [Tsukamurella paurometabola]VDR37727.1 Predicted metal-dependent hydrolase of the TIM-barrel fold [Tsukamurella paurometabola]